MLLDSSLLLLVGLGLAGLIRLLLDEKRINRYLKGGGAAPVFRAALFGIPLPLCSCSVLPVAHQLRRSGVSKGGTSAFLIATPESGADSIVLTYSLMDPVMTIARPITAFLTALTAGLWENRVSPEPTVTSDPAMETEKSCDCDCQPVPTPKSTLPRRLWQALKYAYTDLLPDLAVYLLVGYLLAGLVAGLWGVDTGGLPEMFRVGWGAYVGAIMIGLPLYICALSSTPLAAALLAAGFSPGATLVFLMVGPATNLATLAVVSKVLRGWAVGRYLVSIVIVSLLCGLALDGVYQWFDQGIEYQAGAGVHIGTASWLDWTAAVVLSISILRYSGRQLVAGLTKS
jgi:uncharacterized membrane protein YraQ (UPF0718 family)